jgi:hypothetical protein
LLALCGGGCSRGFRRHFRRLTHNFFNLTWLRAGGNKKPTTVFQPWVLVEI